MGLWPLAQPLKTLKLSCDEGRWEFKNPRNASTRSMLCVKSAEVPCALSMESNQLLFAGCCWRIKQKPFGISFFPHRLGVSRKRFDRWRTNSKCFLMIFFLYRIYIASLFLSGSFSHFSINAGKSAPVVSVEADAFIRRDWNTQK